MRPDDRFRAAAVHSKGSAPGAVTLVIGGKDGLDEERSVTPLELVARDVRLVSLPEICIQVRALADSPYATAADIGEVISKDPALTIRLLKLVNSRYFGLPRKIDTVSRAVSVIGMRELRNLTMATSAAEVFTRVPGELIDMAAFWQHSVYTGLVARSLAGHCGVLHPERLFTAGLLHDVGRLLMLTELPDAVGRVELARLETGRDICAIERELIGFDHAEAGQALLRHWNMPPNLCTSVLYHHAPQHAHGACLEAALLHIADTTARAAQQGRETANSQYYDPFGALLDSDLTAGEIAAVTLAACQPATLKLTGIQAGHIAGAVTRSASAFNQILDLLYPTAWETPR